VPIFRVVEIRCNGHETRRFLGPCALIPGNGRWFMFQGPPTELVLKRRKPTQRPASPTLCQARLQKTRMPCHSCSRG
jgi:hypothetical protein